MFNKKTRLGFIVLVLTLVLMLGLTQTAFAEAGQKVQGRLLEKNAGEIVVNLDSGVTLHFDTTGLASVDAAKGDIIEVSYTGDVLSYPKAESITTISASEEGKIVYGTVSAVTMNAVCIKTADGMDYAILVDKGTSYTGLVKSAIVGNTVSIQYVGSLGETAKAVIVDTTAIDTKGQESTGSSLIDKTLTGTVTKLTDKQMRIRTSAGKSYTFMRVSSTQMVGEKLQLGSTVEVRYDGYASDKPDAKEINVTENEEIPTNKTLRGKVTEITKKKFTIRTDKGTRWTFQHNSDTETTGKYKFEVGCRVEVLYDGYASKIPPAKRIQVTAEKEKEDEGVRHTIKKATVTNYTSGSISVKADGKNYSFEIRSSTKISGSGKAGDKVNLVYREYENGSRKLRTIEFISSGSGSGSSSSSERTLSGTTVSFVRSNLTVDNDGSHYSFYIGDGCSVNGYYDDGVRVTVKYVKHSDGTREAKKVTFG